MAKSNDQILNVDIKMSQHTSHSHSAKYRSTVNLTPQTL